MNNFEPTSQEKLFFTFKLKLIGGKLDLMSPLHSSQICTADNPSFCYVLVTDPVAAGVKEQE